MDVIHPSEMAKADWCPRATYYRIVHTRRGGAPLAPEKFSAQRSRIFQEGNDIHDKYQRYLREMGMLWGKWVRLDKPDYYIGLPPETEGRPGQWRYAEVPLRSGLIRGHADGSLPHIHSLLEIKSIGLGTVRIENPAVVITNTVETVDGKKVVDYDSLWKDIKRPFPSHLRQTFIYGALSEDMGYDLTQTVFIYENKATQATKEFVVKFDRDAVAKQLAAARQIEDAVLHDGPIPGRPRHTGIDTKQCKDCPFFEECYANYTPPSSVPEDREGEPGRTGDTDRTGVPVTDTPRRRRTRAS